MAETTRTEGFACEGMGGVYVSAQGPFVVSVLAVALYSFLVQGSFFIVKG